MIDWLLHFGAGLLGFATFLLAWGWLPICMFWLSPLLKYRFGVSEDRARNLAFSAFVAGSVALWLAWRYLLPDWWVASTPLFVSD